MTTDRFWNLHIKSLGLNMNEVATAAHFAASGFKKLARKGSIFLPEIRVYIKFIFSEKATKFCEISTNYLSYVLPVK